jgi:hypothetical protein
MRLVTAILTVVTAITAFAASGSAAATGYRGQIHIDYRYTSGGDITPGSPADVEQTAHLTLTVSNGRIVHMHGVVGLDYKWRNTGCPSFTVESIGGGTVDAKPVGNGIAFIDSWNWTPPRKGRYVIPAPSVPNTAPVTVKTTSPANDCSAIQETKRETFWLAYVPALPGHLQTPNHLVGTLTRAYHATDCHAFGPTPPPPAVGVSCSWKLRWSLTR